MISRRSAIATAFVGSLASTMPTSAIAQGISIRGSKVLELATAFYRASNRGHWGTLASLLDEDVRLRSNSGYFVQTSESCDGDLCVGEGFEQIGGLLTGQKAVVEFLSTRQQKNGWSWSFEAEKITNPEQDYALSFVSPSKINGGCWGPGVLCGFAPHFVHVFWATIEEEDGVILSARIGEITEVDLRNVGMGNG